MNRSAIVGLQELFRSTNQCLDRLRVTGIDLLGKGFFVLVSGFGLLALMLKNIQVGT